MTVSLRPATAEDLPVLHQFEQGVITAERPFDPFLKEEKISYYNIEDLIHSQQSKIIIAETAEKIVGVGYIQIRKSKEYWMESEYGYLGFMYVEPSFRGQGINQKVIDHLKLWAKSRKINELRLDVYTKNKGAIRAYEKAGFQEHMVEMRLNLAEKGHLI